MPDQSTPVDVDALVAEALESQEAIFAAARRLTMLFAGSETEDAKAGLQVLLRAVIAQTELVGQLAAELERARAAR